VSDPPPASTTPAGPTGPTDTPTGTESTGAGEGSPGSAG
jgi:hypothetical protein